MRSPCLMCLSRIKINKLIALISFSLLLSGPRVIQQSAANFSLNNSRKVRGASSIRRVTISFGVIETWPCWESRRIDRPSPALELFAALTSQPGSCHWNSRFWGPWCPQKDAAEGRWCSFWRNYNWLPNAVPCADCSRQKACHTCYFNNDYIGTWLFL